MNARRDRIVAVVPAAGLGKRFGQERNKSLYELSGKPLIIWVLEALEAVPEITEIIPVLKGDDLKTGAGLIENSGISKIKKIAPGGKERQDSVYNGLKMLEDNTSIVIVHDGARPFAGSDLIRRAITELEGFDGVVAGVPVKDTIKQARTGKTKEQGATSRDIIVQKTLERGTLWAIQTPQVFYFKKLREAHKKARSENYYATDDAALIEKYGGKVKIIEGSFGNIKITTPEDIAIAEALIKASTRC